MVNIFEKTKHMVPVALLSGACLSVVASSRGVEDCAHLNAPQTQFEESYNSDGKISVSMFFGVTGVSPRSLVNEQFTNKPSAMYISNRLLLNLEKLKQIKALGDNWNGNGAHSFSDILLQKTNNIIRGLIYQPELFPTAADSIQIEYDGDKGSYLELQLNESDQADVYEVRKDGSEREYKIAATVSSINKVVNDFYG